MKYVIFGAGNYGAQTLELLGKENVKFFIDNSKEKQSAGYLGLEVMPLEPALPLIDNLPIIIAAADPYADEIKRQLDKNQIFNYETFAALKFRMVKERLMKRTDYISVYKKAVAWIHENTIDGKGIINNSHLRKPYPEVTGYYIPTLIRWGYRDLAVSYARWLCSIQHEDGAWYDTEDKDPYIFDTAQILKGLLAARKWYPQADEHIKKGCDWILSCMDEDGRLVSPLENAWGDGKTFSELIHTYCILPIRETGQMFDIPRYIECADRIEEYYTTVCREQIVNFDLLSHFYAYVMESMLDIGREDIAREAMDKMEEIQKENGSVPAYNNVDWTCSTGLFQLALVWYRLGDTGHGDKAFQYACRLQNESGGWYGSYLSEENPDEINTYFPDAEISWANKYFLDALYYKNIAQFEEQAYMFGDSIQKEDGRYKCIKNAMEELLASCDTACVLDMGCGKGRYLVNLAEDFPENSYYASDLSLAVMKYIPLDGIEKRQGSLTNIPFDENCFDMAYTCEALEHAIDVGSAVRELCRVVRPGGKVVIVDKNKDMLGYFEIEEWEQWFDETELKEELMKYCSSVEVKKEVSFDSTPANGLFYCWTGTVK